MRRSDEAIQICRDHLDVTGMRNSEVETYLVHYLLVLIYADYEQRIIEVVSRRGATSGDVPVGEFMNWAARRLVRSILYSEIKGVAGYFGENVKGELANRLDETPEAAAYNNIITNRHRLAHTGGLTMTLQELERAYVQSVSVLDAFEDVVTNC